MRRYLQIGLNYALGSISPIIVWFIVSTLVDKDLSNVFSITYPIQCLSLALSGWLGCGAGVSELKDKNKLAMKSGLLLTILIGIVMFGLLLLNLDWYLDSMSIVDSKYTIWVVYSVIITSFQTVFSVVLNKHYFEGRDTEANKLCIIYNLVSITSIALCVLAFKGNQTLMVAVSLSIGLIMVAIPTVRELHLCEKGFKINLFNCLKYDSVSVANNIIFFFIFFFGIGNVSSFGGEYLVALNLVTLCTDTQWDTMAVLKVVAQIDLGKGTFSMSRCMINSYKFTCLVASTSCIMLLGVCMFMKVDMGLIFLYSLCDFGNFIVYPYYCLRCTCLQLKGYAGFTTITQSTADVVRLFCSFIPSPFCTVIGQAVAFTLKTLACGIAYSRNKAKMFSNRL